MTDDEIREALIAKGAPDGPDGIQVWEWREYFDSGKSNLIEVEMTRDQWVSFLQELVEKRAETAVRKVANGTQDTGDRPPVVEVPVTLWQSPSGRWAAWVRTDEAWRVSGDTQDEALAALQRAVKGEGQK